MTLNEAQLEEIIDLTEKEDPDLFFTLYTEFLSSSPKLILAIEESLNSNFKNLQIVIQASHNLKSKSGNLGLIELSNLSNTIMESGYYKKIPDLKENIHILRSTYQKQLLELEDYIKIHFNENMPKMF